MRADSVWSQDVVLSALLRHLGEARTPPSTFAFALITGDIAFSGKATEYALAQDFLENLQQATALGSDRIFCVPGNHDVDRSRQRLSFEGARHSLRGPGDVDDLLSGREDLGTLLLRQEHYRLFDGSFSASQPRIPTPDELGYVAHLTVSDVSFAILGLNSAWLAEGGSSDHHNLLIGERQALDAIAIANQGQPPPHILVGLAHHPVHLLRDFEYGPIKRLIDNRLHFFHCGHLHEPSTTVSGGIASNCISIAAGAAFVSRKFHNSYSSVTLDLEQSLATVRVFQYNSQGDEFFLAQTEDFPVNVLTTSGCTFTELRDGLQSYSPELDALSNYFASLILGIKSEVPVPYNGGHIFASAEAMGDLSDHALVEDTRQFLSFRNVLDTLHGRVSLENILKDHGHKVMHYAQALERASEADPTLRQRLMDYAADASKLASDSERSEDSYASSLWAELSGEAEWELLRERTERHLGQGDKLEGDTTTLRYYGLALANSPDSSDQSQAIDVYRELSERDTVNATDLGNLATLLLASGAAEEARKVVSIGLEKFPRQTAYLADIGHEIVGETGDRAFRNQLNQALGASE